MDLFINLWYTLGKITEQPIGIKGGSFLRFYSFATQEERRKFGGSYFIELQYCRFARGTDIETILSAIEHWKNDSLYIYGDDDNTFVSDYGEIFTGGIYGNQKRGMVDIVGINYYSEEHARAITEAVKERKPPDYPNLLNWLETGKAYNGFYILGL